MEHFYFMFLFRIIHVKWPIKIITMVIKAESNRIRSMTFHTKITQSTALVQQSTFDEIETDCIIIAQRIFIELN